MQAIGNDGAWHAWGDLTEAEQSAWMEAMTAADRRHEQERQGDGALTMAQDLARYELKQHFIY